MKKIHGSASTFPLPIDLILNAYYIFFMVLIPHIIIFFFFFAGGYILVEILINTYSFNPT